MKSYKHNLVSTYIMNGQVLKILQNDFVKLQFINFLRLLKVEVL